MPSERNFLVTKKVGSIGQKNHREDIEPKDNLEIQAANGIVRSTKAAKAHIQELGMYLYVKFVEDSPSVLSLGRLCDGLGYLYTWLPGRNSPITERYRTITCCTDNFVPRRGHKARSHSIVGYNFNQALPHRENSVSGKRVQGECFNCWNPSQNG